MKSTKLFSCLFGSKLYGTSTPQSDRDEKVVVLPDLDHLIMGHGVSNSFKKTNKEFGVRNTADDVDIELIPLQVFCRDFYKGQTYALELAFAIDGDHAEQTFYGRDGRPEDLSYEVFGCDDRLGVAFRELVYELRDNFMTSNIKAMMGYVVNQASLYSFKGARLNAVNAVLAQLEAFNATHKGKLALVADGPVWAQLAADHPDYFKVTEYDIGGGMLKPCFTLLEKTLPHSSTIEHTLGVVKALAGKYGDRSASATADNVDWKAMMHAVRIVDEGIDILQSKSLSFPFSPGTVRRYLEIKRGEHDIAVIKAELAAKLDSLKALEKSTTLPPVSPELTAKFEAWLLAKLRTFYYTFPKEH